MYEPFLNSASGENWKRIGLARRAGVATPLFSVYSQKSIGIGELPDLKLLVDWCQKTNQSIIQLLPLNDVGNDFLPYDAKSGFALEPMYLALEHLEGVLPNKAQLDPLRKKFPAGKNRVNYGIKQAKMNLLWTLFDHRPKNATAFRKFVSQNQYWLEDYAFFKVISEKHPGSWENWPDELKHRHPETLAEFKAQHSERIEFHQWLQWQLFSQFKEACAYAKKKGVLMMGDIPFLASRNSADVWARPDYFKLDLSSGAPPDAYFANGQRWGTPPCNWQAIEADGFEYIKARLKYAENFYDLIRIDHVVGFFRLWSIPVSEPFERGGLNGFFDPRDESTWEANGRKLLSAFLGSKMLACAEDLGTVPECSFRVLAEFGIPGIDVQRWTRDPAEPTTFKSETRYRPNSISVISTHDMASFYGWWNNEAGTVYEPLFRRQCEARGIQLDSIKSNLFDLALSKHGRLRWKEDVASASVLASRLGKAEHEIADLINDYHFSYLEKNKFWNYLSLAGSSELKPSPVLLEAALTKTSLAASIFNIQLLPDLLGLEDLFKIDPWEVRINFPGIVDHQNWSLTMPVSLEEMQRLRLNHTIKKINQAGGRK